MSTSVAAVLRLVAALTVLLFGALTVLVVLDILPRELFQTWAIKLLFITGIIFVVALVIALLARQGAGQERLQHDAEMKKQ